MTIETPNTTALVPDENFLLHAAANALDRGVLIVGPDGRVCYANEDFLSLFGYTAGEAIGARPLELLHREDISRERIAEVRAAMAGGRVYKEETMARTKAGRTLCLSTSLRSVRHPATGEAYSVFVFSNVTESRQIQALQRDVLEAIAQDAPLNAVMDMLCRRVEAMAPQVLTSVLQVDAEGCLRPLAGPRLPIIFTDAVDGVAVGPVVGSCGTAAFRGEAVLVEDIETDPLWSNFRELALPLGLRACWSSPIKLRDGRVAGTLAFYYRNRRGPSSWHQHIVDECLHLCVVALERQEAKARIARLAYYDSLTGLRNRTSLREELDQALSTSSRMAVLFFDADHFKDVNDTLGHAVGDSLLVEIAQRLRRIVRPDDILSRLGGDEFVVLMRNADAADAARLAQAAAGVLRETVSVEGLSLPVSASIGISLSPVDGTDGDTLLKNADTAMYQAKAAGRGTFRFFSPHMNAMAQDRLLLGAALRDAIAEDGLELHYQPQIDTRTGAVAGVEALARWRHPVFGAISPLRFITLAEESGQIEALGRWGINQACAQMARWQRAGVNVGSISVNISPFHFRNRDLLQCVTDALEHFRIEPHQLTIEMTERVILDDCPIAIENAVALDALGVRLSMDDFGTGYSSLSHLSKLPAGELKIDRSFVADIETGEGPRAIVTAVVRIGQSLGMRVVAEGVETEAQHRFLAALGCDVLQGYLFAPAMTPEALVRWIKSREQHPAAQVA